MKKHNWRRRSSALALLSIAAMVSQSGKDYGFKDLYTGFKEDLVCSNLGCLIAIFKSCALNRGAPGGSGTTVFQIQPTWQTYQSL